MRSHAGIYAEAELVAPGRDARSGTGQGIVSTRRSTPCASRTATGGAAGRVARLVLRWQPSLLFRQVGLRITLFEACSTFTHVTACMLAESPKATLFTEDFGCFVASTTAPIATGWSDSCRAPILSR